MLHGKIYLNQTYSLHSEHRSKQSCEFDSTLRVGCNEMETQYLVQMAQGKT